MESSYNFIRDNFHIRSCYKYKGKILEECICGKKKSLHKIFPIMAEDWSIDNNTEIAPCDTFGSIRFKGYDNVPEDHRSHFIRFNYVNEHSIIESLYKLIVTHWEINSPRLIISMNGGNKRMQFKNNQQKTNFKKSLIEVMKKESTWFIGSGFNVGINKLVSEAVEEYRCNYKNSKNQVKFIGISTWGVVHNNKCLLPNENLNKNRIYTYSNWNSTGKGQVTLAANCDCFLFCDDGTVKQYDKEMEFRSKFESYVQNRVNAFAVQILYEGGKRSIENIYRALSESIPLVVIKESGRAANIISQLLKTDQQDYSKTIGLKLEEYKNQLDITDIEKEIYSKYLEEICSVFRLKITMHDIRDNDMKLEKKILEAILLSHEKMNIKSKLNIMIRFNCPEIAAKEIFQNADFIEPTTKNIREVLEENHAEFMELFLENNVDVTALLDEDLLIGLYKKTVFGENARLSELFKNFISLTFWNRPFDVAINKMISRLSENIVDKEYSMTDLNLSCRDAPLSFRSVNIEQAMMLQTKGALKREITFQDLYFWALLSDYTELAILFWRAGEDHIGSILIGSIILKNLSFRSLKVKDKQLSDKLLRKSNQFQSLASSIVNDVYENAQSSAYKLIEKPLKNFNDLPCLEIAFRGKLLTFLNTSASQTYIDKVWRNELQPPKSNRERVKMFFRTPKVKCIFNFISYLIFLLVFGYMNMVELKPRPEIKSAKEMGAEIYVYIFFLSFFIEEIRQIKHQFKKKWIEKLISYAAGPYNKIDVLCIVLFIVSTILRHVLSHQDFLIARCAFAVTFSGFCIRIMQYYLMNHHLGRTVIMIRKMLIDIIFFLSTFFLFIIAYGTLVQSLKNPNSRFDSSLFGNILYNPYFNIYGELMMNNIEGTSCNTTACVVRDTTIIFGFAIFLFLTNILLINLLIAIFGCTFNAFEKEESYILIYIQMQMVKETENKSPIPPPFNIIFYAIRGIKSFKSFCIEIKHRRANNVRTQRSSIGSKYSTREEPGLDCADSSKSTFLKKNKKTYSTRMNNLLTKPMMENADFNNDFLTNTIATKINKRFIKVEDSYEDFGQRLVDIENKFAAIGHQLESIIKCLTKTPIL